MPKYIATQSIGQFMPGEEIKGLDAKRIQALLASGAIEEYQEPEEPKEEGTAARLAELEKANTDLTAENKLMTDEKLFLDPELTLIKTSERLGISSKLVSQAINQVYKKNYSQYIADYRVEEAKSRLHSTEYANYKISAIAYDCGFNSISSFNSTFKKLTRITAVEYRQSTLS